MMEQQQDMGAGAAPVDRQAFETYMLNREHPVIGWIDEHWFKRGDHPDTYANDYVQGAWAVWQDRLAAAQTPVAWAPITRGGLLDILACRRSRPSEPGWAPLFDRACTQPELTVWHGPLPESNGKSNFTAVLMRKGQSLLDGLASGFTIACSEYPDRVRYEADCVRYLIGELQTEPDILDYDAELHSGYFEPNTLPKPVLTEGATYESTRGFGMMTYIGETPDIDGYLPTFRLRDGSTQTYRHENLAKFLVEFQKAVQDDKAHASS